MNKLKEAVSTLDFYKSHKDVMDSVFRMLDMAYERFLYLEKVNDYVDALVTYTLYNTVEESSNDYNYNISIEHIADVMGFEYESKADYDIMDFAECIAFLSRIYVFTRGTNESVAYVLSYDASCIEITMNMYAYGEMLNNRESAIVDIDEYFSSLKNNC